MIAAIAFLNGRIVFAYPAARAGTRKAKSKTPPVNEQYNKAIYYALKKTVAMTETKTIKLSLEADEYAENYFYTPEKRIEDGLENAMSCNGKAFGLSIRIAALFHAFQCCEYGKEPADIPISLETMRNAEKVTECLAVHAEKVFAGEDQRNNDALYLLRRIRRYGQREIRKQKMWRGVMSRFSSWAYRYAKGGQAARLIPYKPRRTLGLLSSIALSLLRSVSLRRSYSCYSLTTIWQKGVPINCLALPDFVS